MTHNSSNLCSVSDLKRRLGEDRLVIIDASWYLPSAKRQPLDEYRSEHIPGAVFFDLDEVSDPLTDLPHMLPSARHFSRAASDLGVGANSRIVVYDSAGLFSAARVWWMFTLFGHKNVRVLNGGLPKWKSDGGEVVADVKHKPLTDDRFVARFNETFLATFDVLKENCNSGDMTILDARSVGRFTGEAPEPRAGLKSGHMPHSVSLPFERLLAGGELKPREQLESVFASIGVDKSDVEHTLITSCGSGVTAAIITLALVESGFGMQRLYDGAWAEWASSKAAEILTGP